LAVLICPLLRIRVLCNLLLWGIGIRRIRIVRWIHVLLCVVSREDKALVISVGRFWQLWRFHFWFWFANLS